MTNRSGISCWNVAGSRRNQVEFEFNNVSDSPFIRSTIVEVQNSSELSNVVITIATEITVLVHLQSTRLFMDPVIAITSDSRASVVIKSLIRKCQL